MNEAIEAVKRTAAVAPFNHPASGLAGEREGPEHMGLQDVRKFRVAGIRRELFEMHPGVVDENGQRPGQFFGLVNQ